MTERKQFVHERIHGGALEQGTTEKLRRFAMIRRSASSCLGSHRAIFLVDTTGRVTHLHCSTARPSAG